MFENIPILEINVKIFQYFGILLNHNWKRYAVIIPVCILNFHQTFFLYENREKLTIFILHLFYFVAIFNAILRNLLLIANGSKFKDLLMQLKNFHDDIQVNGSEWIKNELAISTKNARRISIFNLSAAFIDLIAASAYPLISDDRIHPFGVGFPTLDITKYPYYEIIYVFQLLLTPLFLTVMYMPFVNLFASVAMFGVVVLKDLQYKLKHLCDSNLTDSEIYSKLGHCIRYHNRIIRFVEHFNDMVTYIIFAEFILYNAILCALLFCLNIIESFTQKISVIMYIFTMLYVLFTYYWQANELLDESLKVSYAVYDMKWFNRNTIMKKAMLLVMMRSQKELKIMVGNTYPMTLETFQSLLNASYSYFTILRGVTNN